MKRQNHIHILLLRRRRPQKTDCRSTASLSIGADPLGAPRVRVRSARHETTMGCSTSKEPEYNEDGTPRSRSHGSGHPDSAATSTKRRESITARLAHTQGAMSELHDRYDCKNATELGRGACGSVMAVKRLDNNELFALKTISLESMGAYDIEELRNEIELQKKLDHPNICKLLESYEDKKRGTVHIVMEMCTGGMLVSRMKTHRNGWSEQAVATMMEQVLSAIKYCHSNGVVHRDIKLDNIMMEDPSDTSLLKLIDFGFAVQVKRGKEGMQEQLGTPSTWRRSCAPRTTTTSTTTRASTFGRSASRRTYFCRASAPSTTRTAPRSAA